MSAATGDPIAVPAGGTIVLNCTVPPGGHATWFNPQNRQVSRDQNMAPDLRSRYQIVGDVLRGEYNLMLKYITFPQDNGTWWCSTLNKGKQVSNVLVLVPPTTRVPLVTPISGIIFQVKSQAWTFACVAHQSHPPVQLQWVRKTGPETPFDILPPDMVVAQNGIISVSSSIILTPYNHGSVFSCEARHPTFMGQVHSTDVQFVIADPKVNFEGTYSHYSSFTNLLTY